MGEPAIVLLAKRERERGGEREDRKGFMLLHSSVVLLFVWGREHRQREGEREGIEASSVH